MRCLPACVEMLIKCRSSGPLSGRTCSLIYTTTVTHPDPDMPCRMFEPLGLSTQVIIYSLPSEYLGNPGDA